MRPIRSFNHNILPALYKRGILFLFNISLLIIAKGQTTDISGKVNSYYKVTEVIPAKAGVRVDNTSGLLYGNYVMIVQMKGATIQTGTGSTFGDTIGLNSAGNYEIANICAVIGDTVFFFHNLLQNYDTAHKVQLVKFAEYFSARVIDTIKAMPWDSATGKGGVIAIRVDEDLILNQNIYADSSGYRGGKFFLHSGNCNFFTPAGSAYAYNPANFAATDHGAYKGEGVSAVPLNVLGGKGAPANGGGGGNNHNNSGAGGAQLTSGGNGGGNSSTGPVGCTTGSNHGRAGKPLSSWGGTKIFAGGGGGSGHTNGSVFTKGGGHGGGIVFIWANNLTGNNWNISANGGKGDQSVSDGASGGGAGGTIIMQVNNYVNNLTISTNGGKGGDSDDTGPAGRCFGGGGGGSGGVIYFNGSAPAATITTNGGAAGAELNRSACNPALPSVAGSAGQVNINYVFSRSMDPAAYCALLLPVKLTSFTATLFQKRVLLKWNVENPELAKIFVIERSTTPGQWVGWKSISAQDNIKGYSTIDEHPFNGKTFYRLKIIEKNNDFHFSAIRQITFNAANGFTIYPNPASQKITITRNDSKSTDLQLMDISGKLLFTKPLDEVINTIDLPHLSAGTYLLRIDGLVQKLIIR